MNSLNSCVHVLQAQKKRPLKAKIPKRSINFLFSNFLVWLSSPSRRSHSFVFPRYVIEIGIPFLAFAPVRILRVFVYCSEVRIIQLMRQTITSLRSIILAKKLKTDEKRGKCRVTVVLNYNLIGLKRRMTPSHLLARSLWTFFMRQATSVVGKERTWEAKNMWQLINVVLVPSPSSLLRTHVDYSSSGFSPKEVLSKVSVQLPFLP